MTIALRDYQLDAVAAAEEAGERGVQRPLITLPTGTGKTIVFAELVRRRGGRALILAHRDELIEQAAHKVRLVYPDADIGIVKAERDQTHAQVVVASVQTLAHQRRRDRLFGTADLLSNGLEGFQTVVVDEAHHATADTYQRVLRRAGAWEKGGPLTVGVTATAMRADGTPLGDVWQEIVYEAEILAMIRKGYLCDLRAIRVHIEADLDSVHVRGGDLVGAELDKALRDANAPAAVVEAYQKYAPERTALVFTPSVEMAHEIATAFREAGIAAESLDGTTPTMVRRGILERLHTGDTKVVSNCAVLTEGFDEPLIDCVIVARPTKSRPLYVQMIGRGTRTWPGKTDCLIIDVVGNSRRHSLANMATLLGSEAAEVEVREGESVKEAFARVEQEKLKLEATGKLVAQTVDLFSERDFNWIMARENRYVMDVDDGLVVLESRDLQKWNVVHLARDRTRTPVAEDLDLGYAQGVGEDFVRTRGAARLVQRNAPWRMLPATPKQLEALKKWRITPTPNMTRGEASDAMTAASGRATR